MVITVVDFLTFGGSYVVKLLLDFIFVFFPCALSILWACTFRIQVNGTRINVRRFFGLICFQFDVLDIDRIFSIITINRELTIQKITLYTTNNKKVSFDTVMIKSEEMIKFLEENVGEDKFQRRIRDNTVNN